LNEIEEEEKVSTN